MGPGNGNSREVLAAPGSLELSLGHPGIAGNGWDGMGSMDQWDGINGSKGWDGINVMGSMRLDGINAMGFKVPPYPTHSGVQGTEEWEPCALPSPIPGLISSLAKTPRS